MKHIALGHSKLDELLLNEELVEAKKAQAKSKPRKISIGATYVSILCDVRIEHFYHLKLFIPSLVAQFVMQV